MSRLPRSGQAFVEKRLELGEMFGHEPGRDRRRRRPPGVTGALRLAADLAQRPFQPRLEEAPRAHVLGLLLAPDDLGLPEPRQLLDERFHRDRIELLDPKQVDVVDPPLLALVIKIVIDLARADDDPADLIILHQLDLLAFMGLRMIPQQAVEARSRAEGLEVRDGALVAQHRLGRHRDQGLAKLALELAPQRMEEIGRRRAYDDLHVVLGAELQIALEPRGGMFRPLTLVPVRQQAYETGHAP